MSTRFIMTKDAKINDVEISWLGHACFVLKGKEKTVITDPYRPELGYSLGQPEADIVTVSHFHPGHSYVEGIANSPKQVKGPGEYEIGNIFITGLASYHDNEKGNARGKNTIYLMEMEGLTLCHLGDLGHPLTASLVEELGNCDVLFLPVGEVSTIPVDVAVEIVRQLTPHIVIPMHYKTDVLTRNLERVDKFLAKMGIHEIEPRAKLLVTNASLPAELQTVVFEFQQAI
jgi:L-ascorbate metabolism protein UlaG (beta-lactamase superfamily)